MTRIVRRSPTVNITTDNTVKAEVVKENQTNNQSVVEQLDDNSPLQFQKSEVQDDSNETVFTSEESSQKASELLAKVAEIRAKATDNASLIKEPKIDNNNIDGIYQDPFGDQFADTNLETQNQFETDEISFEQTNENTHNVETETEDEAYNEVMEQSNVSIQKEKIEEKEVFVSEPQIQHIENSQPEVTVSIENSNIPVLSKEQIGKYQSQLQNLDIETQISRLKELNQKRNELERRRIHLDAREEQVNKNIIILTEKIQTLTGQTDIDEICKSLVKAYEETEEALESESKLLEDQEKIIKDIEAELNDL
jgi:hypothetical protein